jgi:hypothetical protein
MIEILKDIKAYQSNPEKFLEKQSIDPNKKRRNSSRVSDVSKINFKQFIEKSPINKVN